MITKEDIAKYTNDGKSSIATDDGDKWLKEILEEEKPKNILEIGTYKGIGSLYISQFCDKLYTIDLLDGKLEGEQANDNPIRQDLWKHFGADNIWFQPVKCNNSKRRVIKNMVYDFAFIDGDHSYEGAKLDFDIVKDCGKVLFHDYAFSDREKRDGVYNFVNTLPKEEITVKGIFALWKRKDH